MQQDKVEKNKLIRWLNQLEDLIVGLLLSSILVFAIIQIVSRNFFSSGFIWGDSLLRIIVLWLGLMGAIVASRQGKQISIDVLSSYVPPSLNIYIQKVNTLFAATVCFIIAYYSYQFVLLEYEDASKAFESVPSWITEAIIPIGFFIMGLRYSIQTVLKNKI